MPTTIPSVHFLERIGLVIRYLGHVFMRPISDACLGSSLTPPRISSVLETRILARVVTRRGFIWVKNIHGALFAQIPSCWNKKSAQISQHQVCHKTSTSAPPRVAEPAEKKNRRVPRLVFAPSALATPSPLPSIDTAKPALLRRRPLARGTA